MTKIGILIVCVFVAVFGLMSVEGRPAVAELEDYSDQSTHLRDGRAWHDFLNHIPVVGHIKSGFHRGLGQNAEADSAREQADNGFHVLTGAAKDVWNQISG